MRLARWDRFPGSGHSDWPDWVESASSACFRCRPTACPARLPSFAKADGRRSLWFLGSELPRMEAEIDRKRDDLTTAQRDYLEHAERAQSQRQTLTEYCSQTEVSLHAQYSSRRKLTEKGREPLGGLKGGAIEFKLC
jgi:hypothetical protein